jgi:hypothetical protein
MMTVLLALALQTTAVPAAPPATATAAVEATPAVAERKICRTYRETGSLVRKTKVCRTAADWQRAEEAQREQGREMVSHMNSARAE